MDREEWEGELCICTRRISIVTAMRSVIVGFKQNE